MGTPKQPLVAELRDLLVEFPDGPTPSLEAQCARLTYDEILALLERFAKGPGRQHATALGRDFWPRATYAQAFLLQTLMNLWGRPPHTAAEMTRHGEWVPPTKDQRELGERAKRVLVRLLFDPDLKRPGRPQVDPLTLDQATHASILIDRKRLTGRVADLFDYHDRNKLALAAPLRQLAATETRHDGAALKRQGEQAIDLVLNRKKLRPVDVVDAILSAKYGHPARRLPRRQRK